MYSIKLCVFEISVLIGEAVHVAQHAKHVRNGICSVCVFCIKLLSVLWAREFSVLACVFRLMCCANNLFNLFYKNCL